MKQLNKTEKDLLKRLKKLNREISGFSSLKVTKNKKTYSRKIKHKKPNDL